MGQSITVHSLLKKKFKYYPLSQEFAQAIGIPETNFKMMVYGPSGSGKTTFVAKLCKHFTEFGKVYYNSVEQGEGKSLQDMARLNNLSECRPGTFVIGDRDDFDEMVLKIKKNRAQFIVIDSVQYMNLTAQQYKYLVNRFSTKCFIIISWEQSKQPKGEHAKAIKYMVDIKTRVENGVAHSQSRFGQTQPYRIFEDSQAIV